MSRAVRRLPECWCVVLTLLLLGPALLPGYVLSYDMVWVPRLDLRPDFLGLGTGLPRAVPSDAVVAVLDEVVPGMLLQKLVLVGALVGGGLGAARLVPRLPVLARCATVTVYVWNPFVVERLVIGHWPLLLSYAVLPWLVGSLHAWREGARSRGWWLLVLVGSLSASGGLLVALVVIVCGGGRRLRPRAWLELVAVLVAANAPWLVAGLLHADLAAGSEAATAVFGLSSEGMLAAPFAALGLGGIWNLQVVPTSRLGVLAVVSLLVGLVLAAIALRRWSQVAHRRRLLVLWSLGLVGALATWLVPDVLDRAAASVPGLAVMRDGGRFLLVCAPLAAVLTGHGVAAVAEWFAVHWQRAVVTGLLALAPVALMPDAGWGVSGRLTAVTFPTSYDEARTAVGERGDVLVLPLRSYRAPAWAGSRPVLDPLGRYLRPDYLASDVLVVDGRPLSAEDPRVLEAEQALALPDPGPALAGLGIRTVVVDRAAGGEVGRLGGEVVVTGAIEVVRLPGPPPSGSPASWRWAMGAAWGLYLALLVAAVAVPVSTRAKKARSG